MAQEPTAADMAETDTAPGVSPSRQLGGAPSRAEIRPIAGAGGGGRASSARRRRERARSRRRSPTRSAPRSSPPTRCRSTAACRSSRTSRRRPTRLVGIRALGDEMSVGAFASLAHEAIDRCSSSERATAVVAGGTGLYLRAALADLEVPPPAAPELRARIEGEVDRDRDARTRAPCRARPHRRRESSTRTTDSVSSARSSSPKPASRWSPDEDRLWSERDATADADLRARGRERRAGATHPRPAEEMFARGVVDGGPSGARAAGVSRTAEKALGLREIAELEPAEALERIVVRTRRYAAYQRKWMRRIPGIVRRRDGPSETCADDSASWRTTRVASGDALREVARARQRVPSRRAARLRRSRPGARAAPVRRPHRDRRRRRAGGHRPRGHPGDRSDLESGRVDGGAVGERNPDRRRLAPAGVRGVRRRDRRREAAWSARPRPAAGRDRSGRSWARPSWRPTRRSTSPENR